MEILLGIVILSFVIARLFRRPRSFPGDRDSPPVTGARPPPAVSRPRATAPPARPEVFDAATSSHLPEPRIISGIAWITDGDTIKIGTTQIRLFGVDAPELDHPYGKKAKWALHRLCKGQVIRAEITDEDEYGRTVAQCYLPDGRDLSAEMVKQGMAIDWPKFSGGRYGHLEVSGVRKRLYLADARQKGHMHVWKAYEERRAT